VKLTIEVFRGTQRVAALELPLKHQLITLEDVRKVFEFEHALNEHTQARFHINIVADGDATVKSRG